MELTPIDYFIQQEQIIYPSLAHGTSTRVDHIMGHKTHLNKFNRIEIKQYLLSHTNRIKLELNNRKIAGKSQNTLKLKNVLVDNKKINEKCQCKLKDILN